MHGADKAAHSKVQSLKFTGSQWSVEPRDRGEPLEGLAIIYTIVQSTVQSD